MENEQAQRIVINAINSLLPHKITITKEMQLIGGESLVDSMKLVELCLLLEDIAAENGFEFDWTSEAAMSKSRSMFRSVASLADAFAAQAQPKEMP